MSCATVKSCDDARRAEEEAPIGGVRIVIPVFGAADRLQVCLDSLKRHCPKRVSILIVDDATPDDSIEPVFCQFKDDPRFQYTRSDVNRGFVATCNWASSNHRLPGEDLLLLNSDTEVTAGFLTEMLTVLHLHEKHGIVTPRSNNATIFSIPFNRPAEDPHDSYVIWQQIAPVLPRYQVVPTAVGFCMLIKGEVLDSFELFDEIYSPGYNEENDFACRVNRYGYSCLAANWAYVFHFETSSFGPRRAALEEKHREILASRFPEYQRKIQRHMAFNTDPIEHFADLMIPHTPRILFDAFGLHPTYNGTAEVSLNLLRELKPLLDDTCELYVAINPAARAFFHKDLAGHRFYAGEEMNPGCVFDLAFKPSQIFNWADFQRLNRFAPRLAFTMLDIIAIRCEYLNSATQQAVVRKSAQLCDQVFTISEFSRSDFIAFHGFGEEIKVIHLATNGKGASAMTTQARQSNLLVVGNHYYHKCVEEAIALLQRRWPLTVLGGRSKVEFPNVKRTPSGYLTRAQVRDLFWNAQVIVYPSLYEGFGLPVLDALSMGKAVVLIDTAVARELSALTSDSKIYWAKNLSGLPDAVERAVNDRASNSPKVIRSWRAAADEYAAAFQELLAQGIDLHRLRTRWDCLRTVLSFDNVNGY